jgi:hypothetical protein
MAASGLALGPVGPGAAARSFCSQQASYSGTTITWTGQAAKAHSHDWNDPANWSPAMVPDAGQTPATYQTQYVCIGNGHNGKPATVTIAGSDAFHVAGIDVGQGAQLTVDPGGRLFVGSAHGSAVVPSFVERHSRLELDAGTLGGNGPVTVAGTLVWDGHFGKHKEMATQTSSECVFDPTIGACPGNTSPGGGLTAITASGTMLVDGKGFGGVTLGDRRVIDNSGTIKLGKVGYIAMNGGTKLRDEPGSVLELDGSGGIYRGAKEGTHAAPSIRQQGNVVKAGKGTSVVAVPVTFGKKKPHVRVSSGGLDLAAPKIPTAKVARASGYGSGSCDETTNGLCRAAEATADDPQVATVGTSAQAPKVSHIGVSLVSGHRKVHGHKVIGQAVDVMAPTIRTTHSTHLTLSYDATILGSRSTPNVYRGSHRLALCRVHGLTATNPSCVVSESVAHGGGATKGDLTIVVITIKPNSLWRVA